MSTMKITKAAHVKLGRNGTGDDAFEAFACLLVQCGEHGMGRLAERNHEATAVGIQIVEVVANPEDAAFAVRVPRKSTADAGFAHCVVEDVACYFFHASLSFRPGGSC